MMKTKTTFLFWWMEKINWNVEVVYPLWNKRKAAELFLFLGDSPGNTIWTHSDIYIYPYLLLLPFIFSFQIFISNSLITKKTEEFYSHIYGFAFSWFLFLTQTFYGGLWTLCFHLFLWKHIYIYICIYFQLKSALCFF